MVLYRTVTESTRNCCWSVTWDDGLNADDIVTYSSNVLTIHNGDEDGMMKIQKKNSTNKTETLKDAFQLATKEQQ